MRTQRFYLGLTTLPVPIQVYSIVKTAIVPYRIVFKEVLRSSNYWTGIVIITPSGLQPNLSCRSGSSTLASFLGRGCVDRLVSDLNDSDN
jgi:hypothetical protein